MKASTDSPASCFRVLNLARSKIVFLRFMKWFSNFYLTKSYFLASSSVKSNVVKISLLFTPHGVKKSAHLYFLITGFQTGCRTKSFKPLYPLSPLLLVGKVKLTRWLDLVRRLHGRIGSFWHDSEQNLEISQNLSM